MERVGRTAGGKERWLPWAVLALWVALLAVAVPFQERLGGVTRDGIVDYLPAGAESTRVEELARHLPGGSTADALLVLHRDGGLTDEDRAFERERVRRAAGAHKLLDARPPRVESKDHATSVTTLSLTGLPDAVDQADAVDDLKKTVSGGPAGLSARIGGPVALLADQTEVFASLDGTLLVGTGIAVAVLLVLIYRSPFLWLVPISVVGVAATVAMALTYGLAEAFDITVTSTSTSVMTVLVFGAGTDYALLLVARYREELRHRARPYDAMLAAVRGCGPAVLASAGTVIAGLLCLLAADLNSSSGMGPVGAVGVVCALAAMMTLLPAVLVLLGRRLFWPLIPEYGVEPVRRRRSVFAVMGSSAERRPVVVLVAGCALLGALAVGSLALPGTLRQEDAFVDRPDSVTATDTAARAFPEAGSQPTVVMTNEEEADRAESAARSVPGVASVTRGRSGAGRTELLVFPAARPESDAEKRTVGELRTRLHAVPDAEALVGGATAQQMDLADTNADDRRRVIPLVLAGVLAVLIVLLRSLTAPVVLLLAVIASWGAAMGASGLLFGPALGFEGLDPSMPLLTFVFLVALGVDYGIFLMHRAREERLKGAGPEDAALIALRTTGGVIASAGIVLAATFAVLASLPLVSLVEMGLIIAIGVLLDTFLVRTYLVTSASLLLKWWMWWPGRLSRRSMEG
ncbi:MMPL family transporter [Streptomyces sp. I05A-00742]|uniref:MMPL family transporter n=1 Tax=Streptomyces sp. I05A-00742 TaxID=2732853 RepID=UPI001489720C|nr:MMPL family transporter [Streptomyces sp. I05A-00742]